MKKRPIAMVLTFVMLISVFSGVVSISGNNSEPNSAFEIPDGYIMLGDCNGDKIINSKDIIALKMYLNGKGEIYQIAADVNKDGGINDDDIKEIASIIFGKETSLVPMLPNEKDAEDGTLIYYENFDDKTATTNSGTVMSQLGWTVLNDKDGALTDNTATYNISNYNSGKALYINNNVDGGTDSYVQMLTSEQMGSFYEGNYTLQYDLEYTGASDASRYINILLGYSGDSYFTYHFRNSGYSNNQLRYRTAWYWCDDINSTESGSNTGDAAVTQKLLGTAYNSSQQTFNNVKVSVRYVVDRVNGNSVYMRTLDKSTASKGEWVLISKAAADPATDHLMDKEMYSPAVALKVGGKQNGYIDNIMLWTGTGEEPADKSVSAVKASVKECYNHVILDACCEHPVMCKYCDFKIGEADYHVIVNGSCKNCGAAEAKLNDTIPDGTLVYYENFDSYAATTDTNTVAQKLHWDILSSADGAGAANNSANLQIKDHNGGKSLAILNNKTTSNGSYFEILTAEQMEMFKGRNLTLQYDLKYTASLDGEGYINMLLGYSKTADKYISLHLRNSGYGHHEVHADGAWHRLDNGSEIKAHNLGEASFSNKLIGVPSDGKTTVLNNVIVSVRYVLDWENGPTAYMRTVDTTTVSGGEWVKISEFDPTGAGAKYWDPAGFEPAVAVKVRAGQDGYIDNIMLWTGTGDEPTDKHFPVLNSGALNDGTIIYSENFDGRTNTTNSTYALSQIDWEKVNYADGAPTNSTANYSIKTYNGGKALFINNNITNGGDSYLNILDDNFMKKYKGETITIQYDVQYTGASAADRYFAILPAFSGYDYVSFALRNNGYGNHQTRTHSTYRNLEVSGVNSAGNTNTNSICNKLLGKTYSSTTATFNNVPVSIRYVLDWSGAKVYMRTISTSTTSGGKWVLVSETSTGAEASGYFSANQYLSTIALKIGGKQDGYIDNVLIWKGTGEPSSHRSNIVSNYIKHCNIHSLIPADCEHPVRCENCDFTIGEPVGHIFKADPEKCSVCGLNHESIIYDWYFNEVPAYETGKKAEGYYQGGQFTLDGKYAPDKDSLMAIITETSEQEFNAYCDKLASRGFTKTFENTIAENDFVQYKSGDTLVYAYYLGNQNEVRVVHDKASYVSVDEFGYTYQKKSTDTTTVYQIAVAQPIAANDGRLNCGMMYVIKLADNSVIVIDSAGVKQFNDAQVDNVMNILYDITGTPKGGVVRVAGFFSTHCHSDHVEGFLRVMRKYNDNLKFERIFHNFMSYNLGDALIDRTKNVSNTFHNYVKHFAMDDGAQFMQVHAGQKFNLADVTIEVITTHENMVDAKDYSLDLGRDYNNSSTMLKITIDGKVFLITGDIAAPGVARIMEIYPTSYFKSDLIQGAHHMFNNVPQLYNAAQAPVAFIPQSQWLIGNTQYMAVNLNGIQNYAKDADIYYSNWGTIGLRVVNGKFTEVGTRYPMVDSIYSNPDWWRI